MEKNVGILAIDIYFPPACVQQVTPIFSLFFSVCLLTFSKTTAEAELGTQNLCSREFCFRLLLLNSFKIQQCGIFYFNELELDQISNGFLRCIKSIFQPFLVQTDAVTEVSNFYFFHFMLDELSCERSQLEIISSTKLLISC